MSRSRRKSPIIGVGSRSDKQDKRNANRKLRRRVKETIKTQDSETIDELPILREVSNVYDFTKDGKIRVYPNDGIVESDSYWKKCMRKW